MSKKAKLTPGMQTAARFWKLTFPRPTNPEDMQFAESKAVDLAMAIDSQDIDGALQCAWSLGFTRGKSMQWSISSPDVAREKKRKASQKSRMAEEKAKKLHCVAMAEQLWDEYTPADVRKLKAKNVRKAIGEIMAQRLGLLAPITAETVRSYLKPTK